MLVTLPTQHETQAMETGSAFDTYESLLREIEEFGQKNNVVFVKHDSKTVETANKKAKEKFPSHLKFAYVRFVCKHYGSRPSKSKGVRPNQR